MRAMLKRSRVLARNSLFSIRLTSPGFVNFYASPPSYNRNQGSLSGSLGFRFRLCVHALWCMLPAPLLLVFGLNAPSPAGSTLVGVRPCRLTRLENPIYGSELVLALERTDVPAGGATLPLLLDFSDGEQLLQALEGRREMGLSRAACVLARKESFFEASRGSPLPMPDLVALLTSRSTLSVLLLEHTRRCGLRPLRCELGATGRPRKLRDAIDGDAAGGEVLQRDMGAFTGAQPSGVRSLGSLPARLVCEGDEQRLVSLPLDGPAEAAVMGLPLTVPLDVWEARATTDCAAAAGRGDVVEEGDALARRLGAGRGL